MDTVIGEGFEIQEIKDNMHSKIATSQILFAKHHEVNSLKILFGKKVALVLAERLTKKWYPYLLSVSRNLPSREARRPQ